LIAYYTLSVTASAEPEKFVRSQSKKKAILFQGQNLIKQELVLSCKTDLNPNDYKKCKKVSMLQPLGNNQYLIRFKSKPGKTCLDQLKLKCQIQENLEYRAFPELKR
jgi:hypothetical protein